MGETGDPPTDDAEQAYSEDEMSRYMRIALDQAYEAEKLGEVPVGCAFVHREEKVVISLGSNATNRKRNGTRHCEMEAIDSLFDRFGVDQGKRVIQQSDLFVTCEPCIMCASALRLIGVRRAFYGCSNDRFGGCGSVLPAHCRYGGDWLPVLDCQPGILAEECIQLFQRFYQRGNPNAPDEKRHRPLAQR